MKKVIFGVALAIAALAPAAQAGVIFDSSLQSGSLSTTTRSSDFNYAAVLKFSSNVTISQFGVYTSVNNAQDIKFLIFDSGYTGTGATGTIKLDLSDTKTYKQSTSAGFIYSDIINFTFLAGHIYDVGILGSTGTLTGEYGGGNYTQNGITDYAHNANFSSFVNPTTGGYSGADVAVRLIQADAAVPEPGSVALVGLALAGLAVARRKAMK